MKTLKIRWLSVGLIGAAACFTDLGAAVYLGNLQNRFEDGGIGPVESVPNDWRPLAARFTTGAGSFKLNAVTLEFYADTRDLPPPYWTNADVRLSQERGNESILLGSLEDPTVNPLSTQWPKPSGQFPRMFTTFIDFHPVKEMTLHGWTKYVVEISVPPISSTWLSLLGSSSSNYTSLGEWQMGPTSRPFGGGGQALKLAVDADAIPQPTGYLVPGGISALRRGNAGPGALEVRVIQKPTDGDYTCLTFSPQGRDTFSFNHCLDEGVRAFVVPSNAPISLKAILEKRYPELRAPQVLEPDVPFYVGFYTGQAMITNGTPTSGLGIYREPVFGWAKFVNQDDTLQMLDSALEYGGAGIHAGTRTIIGAPEPPVLNFTRSSDDLLLWWLMSSTDFVLQQSSDVASLNWADVASAATLNDDNFHYEVNIQDLADRRFYRLRSK